MTQLEARCWIAMLRALTWIVQAMIADRIGPKCPQPDAQGVFGALAAARVRIELILEKGGQ